ncbi:MAG: MmgE/PrpD family protein [Paracoccaceae bacterium]
MNVAQQLAKFVLTSVPDATSSGAERIMCLSLFDWAACGMAGVDEPVSRIVRSTAIAQGVQGSSAIFGGGGGLPPAMAALVNGATSHALDYDDTHFAHIGHPSVAVIPAALAIREPGHSDADVLWAALIGAEVSVRVGLWLGRSHYQAGFHQTATAGAFGATAAAGLLLGLSDAQMQAAFGVAATQAAGLKSQFGTMGKPYHAGLAARTGVEAAFLAKAGFDTRGQGIDGPQGFGPTHQGEANASAFEGMGTTWLMETVSHKFHACCHGLHAMLDGLATLEVSPQSVERIDITTHPRWLSVCNISEPATGLETKFSFGHAAALCLCGFKTSALSSFTDELAHDDVLMAIRKHVIVRTDDTLTETEAEITVVAKDSVQTARGNLSAPLGIDTRTDRLRDKARSLLGGVTEQALWQATHEKRAPDLDALSKLMML